MSVAGRAGKFESLTLGLAGTNPRFPWKPSATMLTYRLTGTTEDSESTTTNPTSINPDHRGPQPANGAESSRTMVRLEDGAALLTCRGSAADSRRCVSVRASSGTELGCIRTVFQLMLWPFPQCSDVACDHMHRHEARGRVGGVQCHQPAGHLHRTGGRPGSQVVPVGCCPAPRSGRGRTGSAEA
jgi:hypothetical protein